MNQSREALDAKRRFVADFLAKGDWLVCEYRQVGHDMQIAKHKSYDTLLELVRRPNWIHFVGLATRPGTTLFARSLELTYFPPGTVRNDDFELRNVMWEGMPWDVSSIPAKARRFAERIAAKVQLRIADGVPTIFGSDRPTEPRFFPMRDPNVFHLEFAAGFPVDELNQPGGAEKFRAREDATIAELERRYFSNPERN